MTELLFRDDQGNQVSRETAGTLLQKPDLPGCGWDLVKLWCFWNINLQRIDFHKGDDYINAVSVNMRMGASGRGWFSNLCGVK
jgi:hypothetical protein